MINVEALHHVFTYTFRDVSNMKCSCFIFVPGARYVIAVFGKSFFGGVVFEGAFRVVDVPERHIVRTEFVA